MPTPSRQAKAVGSDAPQRPTGEPKKNGRPSDFKQETADEICAQIATSIDSIRTICKADGMPDVRTVFRWLREQKEFAAAYALAKNEQAEMLVEDLLGIADDGTNDTITEDDGRVIVQHDVIQRSKLRVDTRKWIASKLLPRKYGEKVEVTGDAGKTDITINVGLSHEKRQSIIESRRAAIAAMGGRN